MPRGKGLRRQTLSSQFRQQDCYRTTSDAPRVNDRNRNVRKVVSVAGRESRVVRERDPGDHRVAQLTRATFPLTRGHKISRLFSGSCIEGSNSVSDFFEKRFEGCEQQ